jgi:hypothetical protein
LQHSALTACAAHLGFADERSQLLLASPAVAAYCCSHSIVEALGRWVLTPSLRIASVAEYAEQKLFASLRSPESPQDRLFEWQQLGWLHPGLEACILAANPSWQADLIPAK